MKPVFEALKELLKYQGRADIITLSLTSELSILHILKVINKNSHIVTSWFEDKRDNYQTIFNVERAFRDKLVYYVSDSEHPGVKFLGNRYATQIQDSAFRTIGHEYFIDVIPSLETVVYTFTQPGGRKVDCGAIPNSDYNRDLLNRRGYVLPEDIYDKAEALWKE